MANDGGNVVPRITKAEHIGPADTGDNIEAKRVVSYVWNTGTSEWERMTQPGSALPTGAATAAKQDIGNASLASLDTKLPSQGQALAASSTPVVLPASQITAITPPAAITGYATSAKQDTLLTELQLKADLTETQPVSLASVPSHAVTNAGVFAVQNTAALPAGTNNIGDVDVLTLPALPAGNNNIGDVDVASLPALPAGSNNIGDVDILSSVSSTLDHGSNLDVDTSAEQITSTSFACKFGVTLKADITNTGIIYIGNSDVTASGTAATDGFPLSAGETLTLEVSNSNIPYAIASANNQKIFWVAV